MRIALLLFLFIISPLATSAQDAPSGFPISVGYFGHYAIQPGIKIGTEISLDGRVNDVRNWFVSPQLGFFTKPGDKNNYLINVETGIRKRKNSKNRYHSYALGIGYLIKSKLNSFSVNLGSGNTDGRNRVSTGHLLTTFNYEYGWNTDKPTQWYTKYSVGSTFSTNAESTVVMFIELGVKFRIAQTKSTDE